MASNHHIPVDILLKIKERFSDLGEWERAFSLEWQIYDREKQKNEKQENKDTESLLSDFEKLKEGIEKKANRIEKLLRKNLVSVYGITLCTFFVALILLILLFFVNK